MMYKTLKEGMKSEHGRCKWEIGKWKKVKGGIELCENGFHCSERIIDAMGYVAPAIIAEVEVRGDSDIGGDKSAHREMRIVRAWEWKKEDSVALAIYCAEKVIGIYEEQHPGDKRPRDAIKAAKRWLKNPTEENRAAAEAAAEAAEAAGAAWAARAAAEAARAAEYEKTLNEIETWIRRRLNKCEVVK